MYSMYTPVYGMYGHHIQQSMDQLGKVANPARCQLNSEKDYSSVPERAGEFGLHMYVYMYVYMYVCR